MARRMRIATALTRTQRELRLEKGRVRLGSAARVAFTAARVAFTAARVAFRVAACLLRNSALAARTMGDYYEDAATFFDIVGRRQPPPA